MRSSFRAYVRSLPDGVERVSGGALVGEDGRVLFPPAHDIVRSDPARGLYAFDGTLAFEGHAGVLSVQISALQIHVVEAGRSTVSVAPPGGRSGERPVIAAFVGSEIIDHHLIVPEPRLTWSGMTMLGDVYEVGDFLDPIDIDLHP